MARVLVVDDNPSVLKLVRINLEAEGHVVATATNGSEALDVVARQRPDAVVCDLMMPVTDGYTVLRMLRTDPATSKIPFVVLSAKTLPDDIQRALEMGADRYITKPFDPEQLIEAVAELVAAPGDIRPSVKSGGRRSPSRTRARSPQPGLSSSAS